MRSMSWPRPIGKGSWLSVTITERSPGIESASETVDLQRLISQLQRFCWKVAKWPKIDYSLLQITSGHTKKAPCFWSR